MTDLEAFNVLNKLGWTANRSGIRKIKKYNPDFNYKDDCISGKVYFFRRGKAYAYLTKI